MQMTRILKYSVLSLSLLTIISTTAVSPTLAALAEYFSSADIFLVQLVVVAHAFAIIPSLAAAPWLADRFSRKKVLLSGLLLFTISGVLGGMADDIYVLIGLRLILGAGLGLVIPFSTSLIADFVEGEERQKMMGLSSSLNTLGGMFALIISGYLTVASWRLPFIIYLCGLPVFAVIYMTLPDEPVKGKRFSHEADKFPFHVYKVAFVMLIFSTVFFILTPTMALFLRDNALGDSRIAGFAIAFSTGFGTLSGFMLPRTLRITGKFFLPAMLAITGAGFVLLSVATSVGTVFVGSSMIGFSNRSLYPIFFFKATQNVPSEYFIRATAVVSSTIYIGQFMAPAFQKTIGILFKNPSTRFLYLFIALVTVSVAALLLVRLLVQRQSVLKEQDGKFKE